MLTSVRCNGSPSWYWPEHRANASSPSLRLRVEPDGPGWSTAQAGEGTLCERARLSRIDVQRLLQLATPGNWVSLRGRLKYCARCLFLNPVDVRAPYWKRQWLDPAAERCAVHGTTLSDVSVTPLRRACNFNRVLGIIGRLEERRRLGGHFTGHWRFL